MFDTETFKLILVGLTSAGGARDGRREPSHQRSAKNRSRGRVQAARGNGQGVRGAAAPSVVAVVVYASWPVAPKVVR